MKIIQQNFKVSSKIFFLLFLISTFGLIYGFWLSNYNSVANIIYNLIGGIFSVSLAIYNTYFFSFAYEFKQNEIVVKLLFGLLGEKKCSFKDLKKIEYSVSPKGSLDSINLYFDNTIYKNKVSISIFQVDLSKVRLFLYANVENFEELVEEKQRKFI